MTGMRYHRLDQRLTQKTLARRAHVSRARIEEMETRLPSGAYRHYSNVSKILGVTVEELIRETEGQVLDLPLEDAKLAEHENCYNAISHYRIDRGLSFNALRKLLCCTAKEAKAACMAEESPIEHVELLARGMGLTPEGFLVVYREGDLM